jgi:quinol monooxygenase YgiN
MVALPEVAGVSPTRIRMVVDFPAPLGPKKHSRCIRRGTGWVEEGREQDFITRWKEFVATAIELAGSGEFRLIQDKGNPQHFVSFGSWADQQAADGWRGSEAFSEQMKACRALCTKFEPADSMLVASAP